MKSNSKQTLERSSKRQRRRETDEPPELERPEPPPPPPPALVKLLQKDSAVLNYFRSLQTNLDFDVKKWKTRARFHEQQCHQLQEKLTKLESTEANNNGLVRDSTATGEDEVDSDQDTTSNPMGTQPEHKNLQNVTEKEPTDEIQLEFSSSDEDENEKEEELENIPTQKIHQATAFGIHKERAPMDLFCSDTSDEEISAHPTIDKAPQKRISVDVRLALDTLRTAQKSLSDLGIRLIDEIEPPEGENPAVSTTESNDASIVTVVRRPDLKVATDIVQVVKALARVKCTVDGVQYYPFMTKNYTPCYQTLKENEMNESKAPSNHTPHPAVAGLNTIIQSLCAMDVFCPVLDEVDTDTLSKEFTKKFDLGMRHRQAFVSDLCESLIGEITDFWPFNDRSLRVSATATHMPDTDVVLETDEQDDLDLDKGDSSFSTKSFVRLSALAERNMLATLVTSILLHRQDCQRVFQFLYSYLLSSSPALATEEYPKLPPVQSLCIIESILCTKRPSLGMSPNRSQFTLMDWMQENQSNEFASFRSTLVQILRSSAGIYHKRSSPGLDCRIVDISRVELAAFERIQQLGFIINEQPGIRFQACSANEGGHLESSSDLLMERISVNKESPMSVVLAMVHSGDAVAVDSIFDKSFTSFIETFPSESSNEGLLLSCMVAKRQIEIRQLELYRSTVASPTVTVPNMSGLKSIRSMALQVVTWIIQQDFQDVRNSVLTSLRCCQAAGDAESLLMLLFWLLNRVKSQNRADAHIYSILDAVWAICNNVVIRVINLERRPDRMAAMTSQILNQRLLIVKGVVDMNGKLNKFNNDCIEGTMNGSLWGMHAFDGLGRAVVVEERLIEQVGGKQDDLDRLVEPMWVPHDLKPFDTDAPDADALVRITPSEKACALSHIATWHGVLRSLCVTENKTNNHASMLRSPSSMYRRLLMSGMARGAPIRPANEGMEPVPVCVILEDDAILVDRFSDRLDNLLEELPRDFHFCSLGYSRPKTAPMVPFSSQLAIPTAVWYLTGYVLSLEGARYLLNKLPVRGPVDSWIGMAMFSNWDNSFGHAMGVGVSSKPANDPDFSREVLRQVLRFRAFAAVVPLCSQKVGGSNIGGPATRRRWRQRDTDIVYSGNTL